MADTGRENNREKERVYDRMTEAEGENDREKERE
jgi:hypothetical protein